MIIPKVIHYCWFGGKPLPKSAKKCIDSWKKCCPDYKIIEWNESNFSISSTPLYVQQAYKLKKWAFVTDYVRLKVVYEFGGIYFDTDVEVIKSLDEFLNYNAFFGFENEDCNYIGTGLGFGAKKGASILIEMMRDYDNIPFLIDDGSYDMTPCPKRNIEVFVRYGLIQNNKKQILDNNILILPTDYLCPIDWHTGILKKTKNTHTIHHYDGSWWSDERKKSKNNAWRKNKIYRMTHFPFKVIRNIIGEEKYNKIKNIIEGK